MYIYNGSADHRACNRNVNKHPANVNVSELSAFGDSGYSGRFWGDSGGYAVRWRVVGIKTTWTKADQKIVWRITGEGGEFEAQAQSEDGTVIQPVWEQYHESSTWEHPGEEWGTGFNFPAPECWTISLKVLGTQ